MALECGAGCVLWFHYGGEHKGADKWNAQGVGHYLVMFCEGVFADVQPQLLIEVFEEDAAHIVAVGNDYGVFVAQCPEVGEGWPKHGVSRNIGVSALLVVVVEVGLDRCDVAQNTVLWQVWLYLLEYLKGIFECHGIYDKVGREVVNLIGRGEALCVVHEAQTFGVGVVYSCFVVKAEQVNKERPHFACPENQYLHYIF